MDINMFLHTLIHYFIEVVPALLAGFLISGIIHEFIPENFVERYLASGSIFSILWATFIGALLPICCIGNLAVAISLYKKGARLGPVLAFLVATPATSVTALFVTYRLLGLSFTIYIFFAAIALGLVMGLIGNMLPAPVKQPEEEECSECGYKGGACCEQKKLSFFNRIKSVFAYSFWEMPREIGFEVTIGLILAALIVSIAPIERMISLYLGGAVSYFVALPFAVVMYICSTATVPLVHALVNSGMNIGAGMLLLLVGPVTSFGTLLVVRKQFGNKVFWTYLAVICVLGLLLGWGFSVI
ncbi:MAG: permease [bacterium]